MKKKLTILFLAVFLLSVNPIFAQEKIAIGVLVDGKTEQITHFLAKLDRDIESILGDDYEAKIVPENILYANWSQKIAENNYNQLNKSDKTDVILAIGPLSSAVCLANSEHSIPTILVGVIDPALQEIKDTTKNASGIDNLTYVSFNRSLKNDLEIFYRVFPFKKVGFLISKEIFNIIAPFEKKISNYLQDYGATFHFIPIKSDVNEIISELDQIDAIYVGYLGKIKGNSEKRIIDEINKKKLPSFVDSTPKLEKGYLAGNFPGENWAKLKRRIALNIETIVNGGNPSTLPVEIGFAEKLTINMAAAKKIGFSPRFSVLAEAELINECIDQNSENLSLETVIIKALKNNLDLQIEKQNIASAEKEVEVTRTSFSPRLGVSANQLIIDKEKASNSFGNQAQRTISGKARASQLIYSESARSGVAISKHKLIAAQKTYKEKELDVILEAITAYFDVLRAKTSLNVQKANLKITRKNLEIAKQREAIGYSGKSDVYRWESKIADIATALVRSKTNYKISKINLNRTINRDLSEDFSVSPSEIKEKFEKLYPNIRLRDHIDNPEAVKLLAEFQIIEAIKKAPEIQVIDANIKAIERNPSVLI